MHRPFAVGVAAAAASMAFAAAPALAGTTPIPLSFDHVIFDTPATGEAQVVSDSTQPLKVTANVDLSTGDFTVDPSGFSIPTYSFTSPVTGTATLSLASTASGHVNYATGAVTLSGDFLATFDLGADGSCTVDTGALTLSTATTQPLAGMDFPAGATGVNTGDGAFGVGWSTLPASSNGSACPAVNSVLDGPGGIWVSRGISPTAAGTSTKPAKLTLSLIKPATTKVSKTATISATLANTGGADTKPVKVCLAAKKPLAPTSRCVTVSNPAAGSKKKLVFTLNTAKAKAGRYQLKLTATGLAAKTTTLTLVKK